MVSAKNESRPVPSFFLFSFFSPSFSPFCVLKERYRENVSGRTRQGSLIGKIIISSNWEKEEQACSAEDGGLVASRLLRKVRNTKLAEILECTF